MGFLEIRMSRLNNLAIAVNSEEPKNIQLELFEQDGHFEASQYLDKSKWGFFSVVSKSTDKKIRQNTYNLSKLPAVLQAISNSSPVDTWISQASFSKPNRRAVNLKSIGVLFVDLDYYKIFSDQEKTTDDMIWMVKDLCREKRIPEPSLIISSGKGLQLKWLHSPIPKQALPRWHSAQDLLVMHFRELGSDPVVRDVSRILRIPGTKNSKNGAVVKVVDINDSVEDGMPVMYDFNVIADEILPVDHRDIRKLQKTQPKETQLKLIKGGKSDTSGLRSVNPRALAWDRYMDIVKLAKIRYGDNEVPDGKRDTFLFWAVNFAAINLWGRSESFWHEAYEIAADLTPSLSRNEIHMSLSTVYEKVKQMANGQWIEFNGKKYPPLYTPRNITLINWLEITAEEQKQLKTIISPDEAALRHRERETARSRSMGRIPRTEYEAKAAALASEVKQLKTEGLTQAQISRKLDISRARVCQILKC